MTLLTLGARLEALLFLSSEAVREDALAVALEEEEDAVQDALHDLAASYEAAERGLALRQVAGGWLLSTDPATEAEARRLLARPRTPPLTPAQAETLAIVAYLQPVSRPEIARIRGVNAESAAAALLERGLVEEAGRSRFGAVLYKTSDLFLRLFGLGAVSDLPEVSAWDPSPEVEQGLRERLLAAGEQRAATPPG